MANTLQAKKRARQADARSLHNASFRSKLRTYIKKVIAAIEEKDAEKALGAYHAAVPVIDRTAGKGIIHKNTAARYKSRLTKRIRALNT